VSVQHRLNRAANKAFGESNQLGNAEWLNSPKLFHG
jgi:hypothetical protein